MITNKTLRTKKSGLKHHSLRKDVANEPEKVRLVLNCTEEEKMYIKMLAAKEKKTMTDYLLTAPRAKMPKRKCDFPGCDGIHKPNKLTEKVLKESERGENLEQHETVEDFWKSMGIDLDAQN